MDIPQGSVFPKRTFPIHRSTQDEESSRDMKNIPICPICQIPTSLQNRDDFSSSIEISNLQKTGGYFSNSTRKGKQKGTHRERISTDCQRLSTDINRYKPLIWQISANINKLSTISFMDID
jgi:hypothetical protein